MRLLMKYWILGSLFVLALAGCQTPTTGPGATPAAGTRAIATATSVRPVTGLLATPLATPIATRPVGIGTLPVGTPVAVGTLPRSTATSVVGTPRPAGTAVSVLPPVFSTPSVPSGTSVAATIPSGWQVHRSTATAQVRYSIATPAGWRLEAPTATGGPTSLYSYPASAVTNPSAPVPTNQTKIDITPLIGLENRTLAEVVTSTLGPNATIEAVSATDVNGMPGARVQLRTPAGSSIAVFFIVGAQPMLIQAYGDLSQFDTILSTFRTDV